MTVTLTDQLGHYPPSLPGPCTCDDLETEGLYEAPEVQVCWIFFKAIHLKAFKNSSDGLSQVMLIFL